MCLAFHERILTKINVIAVDTEIKQDWYPEKKKQFK